MKAKVVKAFSGAADGQHHPKMWQPGEIVEGRLADVAVKEKWAESIKEKAGVAIEKGAEPISENGTAPALDLKADK